MTFQACLPHSLRTAFSQHLHKVNILSAGEDPCLYMMQVLRSTHQFSPVSGLSASHPAHPVYGFAIRKYACGTGCPLMMKSHFHAT